MLAIKQQMMIQRLAVGLIVIVLLCSIAYAGLLTNWFRYRLSLEATFVVVPLVIGGFISVLLAVFAYIKGNSHSLVAAVVMAFVAAGSVIIVQIQAFGHMPSFFINDVEKSPAGHLATSQGGLEYWVELKNPFASAAHREYLVVKRGDKQYRISVPIFDVPQAFVSPVKVTDWGSLKSTSNPEICVLTLGPSLICEGRFRINLATGTAERM